MADKKEIEIKLSSDNQVNDYELSKEYADKIIKEITNLKDTRDFVSLKGFLDTRFGKHDYKTINKFLQDFLEQQKAIVISATQLAHLSETGYKGLTEELNALKEQEKKAIGKQKKEIQEIILNKEEELRNSINKSPVGTEAHKLMELHGKGIIDLYDVDNSIKKIYKQINENREIYPELLTLLGRTQKSTDTNFRKQFVVAQQALKLEEQYPLLKGSQRETPRMAATWHNGQLYVIAGTTDASKQEKNKIITEDTKFTSRFKPNYNIAQTASNVNLMRLESGDLDKRAFSYVMYAPTTRNRTLDAFSAPMVFQIGTRSYDEIAKWMHDELDVYEGKKDYKDVNLPGWYVGGSVEKPWTNKEGEQKKTTYWNGKQFKFWLNSKKEEAEQMINSLPEKDKYSFLSLLFGQTKGQFWYDIGNSDDLRDTFLAEYKRLRENEPSYNYYNQDLGGTTIYDKASDSYISIPRESTMESRQKASKDMYEPDVFDIAEEQDIMNLTNDFINHRKPIDAQTAAQMVPVAARRLARIIDLANKYDAISQRIIETHPELDEDSVQEATLKFFGTTNQEYNMDRYLRSKELLSKFPKEGTEDEKWQFIIDNLRDDSNEESKLKSMLYLIKEAGTLRTYNKDGSYTDESFIDLVKKGFLGWAENFYKPNYPYISNVRSMLTGEQLGYAEEELNPSYAEERDKYKTPVVDEKYLERHKNEIADELRKKYGLEGYTPETEIDYFKKRLQEIGNQKGVPDSNINGVLDLIDQAYKNYGIQSIEDFQNFIEEQDLLDTDWFQGLEKEIGIEHYKNEENNEDEYDITQSSITAEIEDNRTILEAIQEQEQKEFEDSYRDMISKYQKSAETFKSVFLDALLSLANQLDKQNKEYQEKQKKEIKESSQKTVEDSQQAAQNAINSTLNTINNSTEEINKSVKKKQYLKPDVKFGESYNISMQKLEDSYQEENKPVLKDGVYVWSRTGRRLSAKQLSSRGLQNNPPSGNIQYSGGPIPVYPAGQGGDLDPNKTYKETGITVDAENKIVSRTLKEVQKRQIGGKRGSSQLDVIKQIKEDTGKIVNIMEQQPPVSGGGMPPEIPTTGGSISGGSKKGKSKKDKQKEKEEKQAAAQRKRDNQEYAKSLKTVYDYQLKIDDARRKSNITSGRERKSQQEFINTTQKQLKAAQRIAQEKRKVVTDKDAALIESGLEGQFSVKRAAIYTKDKGARNIFDLMGDDIKRAFQRITDFGVAARILNKVQKEIANVYQNILKLNEAMTDIRIVTGANVDEANSLMTSYNKLAKELGTTTTEVAKSASEWMRQGYTASESVNLIASSVKLARLGFMDMTSATTSLTAVLKGFNLQATESSEIVDKLTKLDAEYATTAGDIANALSRTAAAAKAANLDLDQTASMLTTIIDITQQDAGSVGNALKTILSRYGNVKAGVFAGMEEDGEDASESINDVEKVLNTIGIQIRSTSTEMRGFDEVLDDLAEKWDNLNDVEQNAVATAMAGVRQRNQFLALMQNYDQYKESLESSRTSSGTADEKYAAVMDSIATSMQKIQTAWESFTQKLQASGFVKGFFKTIAFVVERIDKFLPHAVALLTSMTARHLPVLGMQIKGLFGDKSSAGRFVRSVFGRGKTFEEESLKQLGQYKKGIGYKDDELSDAERRALGVGGLENTTDDKTALNTDQIKSDVGAIKSWLLNNKKDKVSSQDAPDNAKQDGYSSVNKNKKSTNYLKKIRIISGAITGLATGISSGMTANYGDFTSGADKAITGLASGVATGLISAFPVVGPLFGNILGPLIGQGIGKIFYNEFHKEEIARRARVDEAKKQLEATQKVESAITSAEELTSKDRSEWGSEEYKQEKELIDQMRFGLQTSSSLAENFAKLSGASTEASDWIIQLSRDLTELDESVVANYRAAQILTEAQETYKAGEEDRAALYDKLGSTEASMLNQIQNIDSASSEYLEKRKEYESEYGRTVESGIASMQQAQMQLDAFTDALHEGYMKAAFYSSGVSQMSSADITGASLDRVVAEVARAWAASDATALVFANGTLLESARKQIIAYLKTQSDFTSLTKSPGGSLRDIMGARDEIGTYLQRTNGDYERLKNIVNQQDFKKIREFFGYDAENTENDSYIKDLIDQINKADPSNIELIAHGMNMTTEQAENLKSVIGSISLEDILNGAGKLLDKFETLNGILGDISEDSILSPENINKVVSTFPDLFKEFDENGNFTGNISSGNIIGNLAKLVTDPNGALATAYAGLAAKGSLTDKNKWKIFQDSAKANQKTLGITDEQLSDIMTAKDFNSQAQLMLNNQNLMAEWAKIVTETTGVADYAEQVRNILIEAENKSLEKQIDNLQSIKDSIGDINKQREKELDLIKARDALENAKKEKKLVYRAGIGFVATSDSSAIQEAQKKVDDLQNQQTQEDLQYQIDQLNQQKAILEAIQNDPKIESIKNSAKEIEDALSKGGDGTVLGYLQMLSTDTFVNNIKNAIKESAKENTQDVLNEEYISSLKNYNKSVTDYQGWLDTEARKDESGNSVYWKDILNNTADRDYSAAKEQAESFRKAIEQNRNDAASKKKSSILSSEQISKEMNGSYYSPEAGIDGLMNEKGQWNQKLEDASNTFLISADGVEGQKKMAFYARLLNEEITDPDFISNQINKDFENSAYIAKRNGSGFERFQKAKDLNKNYTEWSKIPDGYMIINVDHLDDIAYKDGGKLFQVSTKYYNDGDWKTFGDFALDFHNSPDNESYQKIEKMKEYADSHGISYNYLHNAKGTYNTLPGNHQIINELGTEAIVTPQGTLTSLPSHSGIVPADLTKNLFALGEIAPNLIATLRNQMPNVSKSNSTNNDNSTNIGTVYATFNADSGFDMNRFMIDLRSAAGNTRHNN